MGSGICSDETLSGGGIVSGAELTGVYVSVGAGLGVLAGVVFVGTGLSDGAALADAAASVGTGLGVFAGVMFVGAGLSVGTAVSGSGVCVAVAEGASLSAGPSAVQAVSSMANAAIITRSRFISQPSFRSL